MRYLAILFLLSACGPLPNGQFYEATAPEIYGPKLIVEEAAHKRWAVFVPWGGGQEGDAWTFGGAVEEYAVRKNLCAGYTEIGYTDLVVQRYDLLSAKIDCTNPGG